MNSNSGTEPQSQSKPEPEPEPEPEPKRKPEIKPEPKRKRWRTPSWIAFGFIGAFAASVLTVIYTGLMVEGSPGEFDAEFRSVTMHVGETRAVRLVFDVRSVYPEATLEVQLPPMVEPRDAPGSSSVTEDVSLVPGDNEFSIEIRATGVTRGYMIARLLADEPVALERVFVTVDDDEGN
jgi:hypothetical protein